MAKKELASSTAGSGVPTPMTGTPIPPSGVTVPADVASQAGGNLASKAADSSTIASKGRGAFNWGQVMWQRWYWGLFFAVAWAVSSRITGGGA